MSSITFLTSLSFQISHSSSPAPVALYYLPCLSPSPLHLPVEHPSPPLPCPSCVVCPCVSILITWPLAISCSQFSLSPSLLLLFSRCNSFSVCGAHQDPAIKRTLRLRCVCASVCVLTRSFSVCVLHLDHIPKALQCSPAQKRQCWIACTFPIASPQGCVCMCECV